MPTWERGVHSLPSRSLNSSGQIQIIYKYKFYESKESIILLLKMCHAVLLRSIWGVLRTWFTVFRITQNNIQNVV